MKENKHHRLTFLVFSSYYKCERSDISLIDLFVHHNNVMLFPSIMEDLLSFNFDVIFQFYCIHLLSSNSFFLVLFYFGNPNFLMSFFNFDVEFAI